MFICSKLNLHPFLVGNIRQPKWGHLKELHASIKMMEKAILYGDVQNTTLRPGVTVCDTNSFYCYKFSFLALLVPNIIN